MNEKCTRRKPNSATELMKSIAAEVVSWRMPGINGWDCGISVSGICNGDTGQDESEVTLTSGSGYGRSRHIGTFTKEDIEHIEQDTKQGGS